MRNKKSKHRYDVFLTEIFLKYSNQKALMFKFQEIFFGISNLVTRCGVIAATTVAILAIIAATTTRCSSNACLVEARSRSSMLHYRIANWQH
jgi:hypothetical protein